MENALPPYLANKFPVLIDHWDQLQGYFYLKQVPAHTLLLSEGTVATNLYLIVHGSLRMWRTTDQQETTLQFFFENQPVASFESFYLDHPSDSSIETLESTTLLVLSKTNFDHIRQLFPEFEISLNRWLCERFIAYRQRVYTQLEKTPTGRYQALVADNPDVLERVPLHEIATYLGITPVSLSRIRSKLKKQS
ncbi:Crp/Fnr family transcriptional regulator [Lactiplantibacillus paraplantarum]|uniref:Crp/Fnr family transcriptional regulator n=1 Tax=Lactiplantibacillus paraplantarum TaxID=60520 RepID=UPI0021A3822F|nr:Crp/Fnr family transcriptional regulator [Lactiplantibacillus paraplantarum]MCT4458266.1 Crp/Fnr family transcriptional regulator [Lactiplantibacillus paraplantarum]